MPDRVIPAHVRALAIGAGIAAAAALAVIRTRCFRKVRSTGKVVCLHRFAVKGLGHDKLESVDLCIGDALPKDRTWALLRGDAADKFDPADPKWVHKMRFHASCSAGDQLYKLRTSFSDVDDRLEVRDASNQLLRSFVLTSEVDRAQAEQFFGERLSDMGVRLVRALERADGRPHHFCNTTGGLDHNGDLRVLHLLNLQSVRALSAKAGVSIDPLLFRGNVLLDGLEPFEEFDWVGQRVLLGDVEVVVVKRTVRCAATSFELGTGRKHEGMDVPALLSTHFPEHGPYLGVYAQVVKAGRLAVGDAVRKK